MAKTLNEIIYDIKNSAFGGFQSDDVQVSDRQVAYWINEARDTLIGQLLSSGKSIPESAVQHLECVQLECLDAAECCEFTSCNKVLRSTQKLPRSIQTNDRNSILSVESPDKTVGFSETTYFRAKTNKYNRYTGNNPRWFIKNDYLYVINEKMLEYVSVSGIFEDPTEATLFTTCDGAPCFTWDTDYPITQRMARLITTMILQDRLGITQQTPNDTSNNAKGTETEQRAK